MKNETHKNTHLNRKKKKLWVKSKKQKETNRFWKEIWDVNESKGWRF